MKTKIAATIVLVSAVSLYAYSLTPLSLKPRNWTTISSLKTFPLNTAPDGSLTFDFPGTGQSVNYLFTVNNKLPKNANRAVGLSVSFAVQTSGPVVFDYHTEPDNTCIAPATVRPFILADNDWSSEYGRWWSNPTAYLLAAGSTTLTIPFAPDQWSDVYGHVGNYDPAAEAGFAHATTNLSNVGVTFGGGCFFGHGVFVTGGRASFYLTDYSLWTN
jgi:hypothetical protein